MKKLKYKSKVLLAFLVVAFIAFGFLGDDRNGVKNPRPLYKGNSLQQSGKQGDAFAIEVNNIYLPINRKGIIADVNIPPPEGRGSLGQFAGHGFLFSSGFFISGFSSGTLWAAADASASLVEDFVPGTEAGGQNDPNAVLYVIDGSEPPYNADGSASQSWSDWKDAVALGADFYDGDGDGIYNPQDKNLDGEWNPDEDRPDLIGDIMAWCVYHDGLPVPQRRWATTIEVGLEIRQSVFAFASAGAIGNLIFVRYRFKYVGLGDPSEPDILNDVYFGVWADPDIGDADDDLVGSDVPRNAGFTYNDGPDPLYGNTPPCFMIDFFQGPLVYIPGETFIDNDGNGEYNDGVDTPLDTGYSVRGQIKGVVEYPGAKNLPISSFVEYRNGDPILNDPGNKIEARNLMLGLLKDGTPVDACTFLYGEVRGGALCDTINPLFWLSGDPVTDYGWINTPSIDQRQMTNAGPFVLKKNDEKEIVVAYVVNNGADAIDAITQTRKIDDGAQNIFNLNFLAPSPPPAPRVTLTSSDNFIDIVWPTPNQVKYTNVTPTWNLKFEGYRVWAFASNNTQDFINGQQNSKLIATYDLNDFIKDVYKENAETGGIELLYPAAEGDNSLNYNIYSDAETGLIRLRIFDDPFNTNSAVTKGKPYFFAVTAYALNYDALVFYGGQGVFPDTGNYYLSTQAFAQEAENPRSIRSIIVGENLYNPPVTVQPANKVSGASLGNVGFDVINNDELTGDTYEVTFFKDSASVPYSMYWKLTRLPNTVLQDSSKSYTYGSPIVDQKVTDGFITKVEEQNAKIGDVTYYPEGAEWYAALDSANATGIWYVGKDLVPTGEMPYPFPSATNKRSSVLTTDKIRKVELRFGDEGIGKAYRYISGYTGIPATNFYPYASKITSSDTTNKGKIGNWDEINNRPNGFVDVPFTAWMVDERYFNIDNVTEPYQLAVGFIERRKTNTYPLGNPDGIWDPGTSVRESGEMIVIFDSPYDANGAQIELTGGDFQTTSGTQTIWADLARVGNNIPVIPNDAQGITDQQKAIFASPWLNTMHLVGLERSDSVAWFTSGDILTIPLAEYPYTANDAYQFSTIPGKTLTEDQERALWEKVNVYPNPLYGFNILTSYTTGGYPDEPFVTFINLPEDITIKIYSLSGSLLRTLTTDDKSSPTSPFVRWNLQNESSIRVASGMYLAIVSSPKYGDKVLKFAIIMPQKQIQRY
jgi:hypothetical protein